LRQFLDCREQHGITGVLDQDQAQDFILYKYDTDADKKT